MTNCLYCGGSKNVRPLKHWDKEQFDYFCSDHFNQVRNFQEEQKRGFIEHFRDHKLRETYLNKQQQELYRNLTSK